MKKISEYKDSIPNYAINYLINDDKTGLNESEISLIDNYVNQYYDEAKKVNGSVIINLDNDNEYFSKCPAFGLPCMVYDVTILIVL